MPGQFRYGGVLARALQTDEHDLPLEAGHFGEPATPYPFWEQPEYDQPSRYPWDDDPPDDDEPMSDQDAESLAEDVFARPGLPAHIQPVSDLAPAENEEEPPDDMKDDYSAIEGLLRKL